MAQHKPTSQWSRLILFFLLIYIILTNTIHMLAQSTQLHSFTHTPMHGILVVLHNSSYFPILLDNSYDRTA